MFTWPLLFLVPLLIVLGAVVMLALLSIFSRRPDNLGVKDGRLSPCPTTPNCVSTQSADDSHRMEPLRFDGSPADAMARLKRVLAGRPRARIISETETYLHAEFTSLVFRFVDDVEFLIDAEAKVVHFRSASRVGRSDLGANRARMKRIQKAWRDLN